MKSLEKIKLKLFKLSIILFRIINKRSYWNILRKPFYSVFYNIHVLSYNWNVFIGIENLYELFKNKSSSQNYCLI